MCKVAASSLVSVIGQLNNFNVIIPDAYYNIAFQNSLNCISEVRFPKLETPAGNFRPVNIREMVASRAKLIRRRLVRAKTATLKLMS